MAIIPGEGVKVKTRNEGVPPREKVINVASRFNRMPKAKYFLKLVLYVCIGGWFEFYELFLAGYLGAALVSSKYLTKGDLAIFLSAGFLGMFIGTIVAGILSDLYGRKKVFLYSMAFYSLCAVGMAFTSSVWVLIFFRLLAGFGVGAQFITCDTYLSEMTPSHLRGRYLTLTNGLSYTAVPVVSFLSYLLIPTHFLLEGWRWVLLLPALAGLFFAWWIGKRIPESPRWFEIKGRHQEANQVMERIEKAVMIETNKPLPEPVPVMMELQTKSPFREIWSAQYRGRTIMMVFFHFFQAIGYYGFNSWIPTLIAGQGITLVKSFFYTSIIALANPFGPLLGMYIVEKFERKYLIAAVTASITILGLIFSKATSPVSIVILGILLTLLLNLFSATYHAYQTEVFPTRARATGVGFTYSFSRLGSITNSFIVVWILGGFGVPGVYVMISASMFIVGAITMIFGPKTNGKQLEEVSA
jgi:MFS transporter, putative metabolite:H+ symporter